MVAQFRETLLESWRANAFEFRENGVHSCAGTQRDVFCGFSRSQTFPETHLFVSVAHRSGVERKMAEIVECVPNFSTSDPEVVQSIVEELKKTKSAFLLDYSFDDYYNRLVVSFVGDKKSVLEAALKMSFKAVDLIDMKKHTGQHPRIGAVDVVPFIPSKNVTIDDCIELSKRFGQSLAEKCQVPVYLYGAASKKPERKDPGLDTRGRL